MSNFILLFTIALFSACSGTTLQVGTSINSTLAYMEDVKLSSIPFTQRTKNVFFSDETNLNVLIKGISAIDLLNSTAKASVTSGGVGSSFVNIRLKGSRGGALNYQVQIFR